MTEATLVAQMVKKLPVMQDPLSESGMSRNFWGRIKGAKYHFALQGGRGVFP